MKNCLQIVTAAALLLTASFGLRNLMTPASTLANGTPAAYATGTGGPVPPALAKTGTGGPVPPSLTGTGGPVPPALTASFSGPDTTTPNICTGTGGPVPPCFAAKGR